jgi:hypothetical protein
VLLRRHIPQETQYEIGRTIQLVTADSPKESKNFLYNKWQVTFPLNQQQNGQWHTETGQLPPLSHQDIASFPETPPLAMSTAKAQTFCQPSPFK